MKIKSKKAGVDLVVVLIAVVIFASVSLFFMKTIMGDKTTGKGIGGAADRTNSCILKNMP